MLSVISGIIFGPVTGFLISLLASSLGGTVALFGMVPILAILVYTGSQLGDIETFSMAAIFTPGLILSLCLLAAFPFLARAMVRFTRRFANSNAE